MRGMGSTPIIGTLETGVFIGKVVRKCGPDDYERSRIKAHEKTVYPSTIRQTTRAVLILSGIKTANLTCSGPRCDERRRKVNHWLTAALLGQPGRA